MKALITGITGQDGAYLAQHLLNEGFEVHGLVRSHTPNLSRLNYLGVGGSLTFHVGDVASPGDVSRLVNMRFHHIYNLAAQSFVGSSWETPHTTTYTNALGPLNFLDAIHKSGYPTKLYQASTSEMFGNSPAPQNEDTRFSPRSPYGVSKLYAHELCRNYRESHGVWASCGILFNHESPLRGPQFFTRKVTLGLRSILGGKASKIPLGNLDFKRDWGFAGDYVRAMHLIMEQKKPEDYVVATGETYSGHDFLKVACDIVGLDPQEVVEVRGDLFRPAEVHVLCGNPTKIRGLGWEPRVSFKELVGMMVEEDCSGTLCGYL